MTPRASFMYDSFNSAISVLGKQAARYAGYDVGKTYLTAMKAAKTAQACLSRGSNPQTCGRSLLTSWVPLGDLSPYLGFTLKVVADVAQCSADTFMVAARAIGNSGNVRFVGSGTVCPRLV